MNIDKLAVIEALVALGSLQLCMHQSFSNIILESDCLLLVEEILPLANPSSLLGNLVLDIRNLSLFSQHFVCNLLVEIVIPNQDQVIAILCKHTIFLNQSCDAATG